jgi:hypothetical protein
MDGRRKRDRKGYAHHSDIYILVNSCEQKGDRKEIGDEKEL